MSGIIVYCRRMVGRLRMSMLATLFGSNLSRDQPKSQHSTACNFVFLDLNIRPSRLLFRSEKRGRKYWKRISWLVIYFCCVRKICCLTADEISSLEFFKNSNRKNAFPEARTGLSGVSIRQMAAEFSRIPVGKVADFANWMRQQIPNLFFSCS